MYSYILHAHILHYRRAVLPVEVDHGLMCEGEDDDSSECSVDKHMKHMDTLWKKVFSKANMNIISAQTKQKYYYDARHTLKVIYISTVICTD